MFKLIKFIFWVCIVIILAYFMTDLKIGGKTVKQNIDDLIGFQKKEEVQVKAKKWVGQQIKSALDTIDEREVKNTPAEPGDDDIKDEDKKQLTDLIKKNK